MKESERKHFCGWVTGAYALSPTAEAMGFRAVTTVTRAESVRGVPPVVFPIGTGWNVTFAQTTADAPAGRREQFCGTKQVRAGS